jgi:hypothetical protein
MSILTTKSIYNTTPKHVQMGMRKIHKIPACVKKEILEGNKSQGAYIQFNQDVGIYGLFGGLAYVQGYEHDGYYVEGTAEKAINAFLATKAGAKLLKEALS